MGNLQTAAKIYEVVIHSATHLGGGVFLLDTNRGQYKTKAGAKLNQWIESFADESQPDSFVINNPTDPRVVLLVDKDSERVWGIQYNGKVLRADV